MEQRFHTCDGTGLSTYIRLSTLVNKVTRIETFSEAKKKKTQRILLCNILRKLLEDVLQANKEVDEEIRSHHS